MLLTAIFQTSQRDTDKPFVMPVEGCVFSITGRGTVATGREAGTSCI